MTEPQATMWTASRDHYATGEGRTFMALISYAWSEEEIRKKFGEEFDSYFAQGCTIEPGVVRNDVTKFLWSDEALKTFEEVGKRGSVKATSYFHFNLA